VAIKQPRPKGIEKVVANLVKKTLAQASAKGGAGQNNTKAVG
jgi:hypothetical protein